MMKKIRLVMMAALFVAVMGYSAVLVSEDFETYSPGDKPVATRVSAGAYTATGENFITTTSSATNTAGTGIGVHIRDNNATSTALEWEYGTGQSAIKVSFDFSQISFIANASKAIRFGVGQAGQTLGAGSRRYVEAAVYDNGTVRVYFNGSSVTVDTVSPGESHNITLFANDSDTNSVTYTGPDSNNYILPANSVAWWYDNVLVLNGGSQYGDLDLLDATAGGTVETTDGNLNRAGFVSSTSDPGLDYVFDNIEVSTIVSGPEPEYLVDEDFETGQTVGASPTGASVVRPTSNGSDLFNKIVAGSTNSAGTGNGVYLFDKNLSAGIALEYNFVPSAAAQLSAVRAEFTFSFKSSAGTGAKALYAAFGEYNASLSLNSSSRRFTDARLYNDGTLDLRSNGGGSSKTGEDVSTGSHTLVVFANDFDSKAVFYTGPDTLTHSLAANTAEYWLDGLLYHTIPLDTADTTVGSGGTVGTTTNNLGKFGFSTGSSETDIDIVIDDIKISSLETDAAPPPPDFLFKEDFEAGQTVGNAPTGASQYRPNPAGSNAYVQIVDSSVNVAGSGNGVQLFDDAPPADDPNIANLEYNFVAGTEDQVAAVRIDFAFAALDTSGAGDDYIAAGVGEYNVNRTFQTTANRYIDTRLYNDGTIDFRTSSGTNAPSIEDIALLPGANTLSIYVNDYDAQSIEYTGPNASIYSLPANSVAYWLNGSLMVTSNGLEYLKMDLGDSTGSGVVSNTTHNLGKFGFNTGTSDTNLNYVIDDILITTNLLILTDNYTEWVDLFPTLGSSTNYADDPDLDGMDNLLEYALGGSPVVDDASSILPGYAGLSEEGGTNYLNYVYNRNVDATDLTYSVLGGTNLLTGSMTNATEEAGASAVSYGFQTVTNRVSTDTESAQFMGLTVKLAE